MLGRAPMPAEKKANAPLLQFRAGRMTYENGTVTPQLSKGHLRFFNDQYDANRIIMTWSSLNDRADTKLVKGKTTVSFVEQCKTGRVLLFETASATSGTKRHFYWLQDKSTEKDAEYLSTLKKLLTSDQPAAASAAPAINLEEFNKMISNIVHPTAAASVKLTDVLASPKIAEALKDDADFYKERLKDHLPYELGPGDSLTREVKNPQVSRSVAVLQHALSDPATYKELCKQFGITETDSHGGVTAFLNGIIKDAEKKE